MTANGTIKQALHAALNASFIVYDKSFLDIIGTNSSFNLIAERSDAFTVDCGAWAWDRGEIWFASGVEWENATAISILHLADNTITTHSFAGDALRNPNGAYYYNRPVYFTTAGNETHAGGVVAIDPNPETKVVTTILNSYFGFRFSYIDDVAWVRRNGKDYMFLTDLGAPALIGTLPALKDNPAPQLQNAVWRFDPQRQSIRPVISRADCALPNGVRANAYGTKLYVTDSSYSGLSNAANSSFGSGGIYEFDLNESVLPVQKSLFHFTRQGLSNGIKVDDAGNVWTVAYDGIWCHDKEGVPLGVINESPLLTPGGGFPPQNFAIAGDTLVIFAQL